MHYQESGNHQRHFIRCLPSLSRKAFSTPPHGSMVWRLFCEDFRIRMTPGAEVAELLVAFGATKER